MTRLSTERLILRAAHEDDLAPLFRILNNPVAMRYWSNLPHQTPEETRPTLEKLGKPGPRQYFVFEHAGSVIGIGGIHTEPEIGYILHPDYWGQGFATEAVQAVISHIWDSTDWPRITADVDPRNLKSVGMLTRLGFLVTGYTRDTFKVGEEWSDSVYFALPRPD